MNELALEAGLCYNRPRSIVVSKDAVNTLRLANLCRRLAMDMIPQDNTPYKRCTNPDCKNPWLPATTEFFYPDKRRKDGFNNPCKACRKVHDQLPEVREHKRVYMKAYSQSEHGREINRISADKPENRTKKSIRDKKRCTTPDFRERQRPIDRAYYHDPENHDRIRTLQSGYYSTPEWKTRRKAYEQSRYGTSEWKVQQSVYRHIRRARKNTAPGKYTAQDVQSQYKRQKGKCYWCHSPLATYEIDHIVPLSRGGSNWPDNIVIACPFCNRSKNNRLPHEWYRGGRLL